MNFTKQNKVNLVNTNAVLISLNIFSVISIFLAIIIFIIEIYNNLDVQEIKLYQIPCYYIFLFLSIFIGIGYLICLLIFGLNIMLNLDQNIIKVIFWTIITFSFILFLITYSTERMNIHTIILFCICTILPFFLWIDDL